MVSKICRRRIERVWSGHTQRPRKSPIDNLYEQGILDVIGPCPFVCSVQTSAPGPEASQERALITARLALTAVALIWQQPSQALKGMNLLFDHELHIQRILPFTPGQKRLPSGKLSRLPSGPSLKAAEWETALKTFSNYFAVVSEVLGFLLDATSATDRPTMKSTLAQALLSSMVS